MSDDPYTHYLALMGQEPELFDNPADAPVRILSPEPAHAGVFYRDRFIHLIRDRVSFPDGNIGGYLRVLSPIGQSAGAAVLPVQNGQIVLLRHFRHATRRFHLEIPRGMADPGETTAQTAHRELFEETGLTAASLTPIGSVHPDTGLLAFHVDLFLAVIDPMVDARAVEAGLVLVRLSADNVKDSIAAGEISDGFTLAAWASASARGLL